MEYYDFTVCPGVREITAHSNKKFNSTAWNYARIFSDGTRVVFSDREEFIDLNYHQTREHVKFPNTSKLWTQKFSVTDHALDHYHDKAVTKLLKQHRQIERESLEGNYSLMIQASVGENYIDMVELLFKKELDLYASFNQIDLVYQHTQAHVDQIQRKFSDFIALPGGDFKPLAVKPGVYIASKTLSGRELDCATLLLRGRTKNEMAQALNLSVRTIESYMDNLKTKLNACSNAQLSNYLLAAGLYPQLL